MIYRDFGKSSFGRGFRERQIQNDFMSFNLQSRSYLDLAARGLTLSTEQIVMMDF